ncbi:MAG: hypothetical protein ACD_58C00093G0005 [uncultured bacterium]|nr:MAG: hypothetical protein ACD_58C00093G0005 [uncultured bacterium]
MEDLIYSEECYQIMGILFGVYKKLGYGLIELDYQKAVSEEFKLNNFLFSEQAPAFLSINNKNIRRYYLDFLVDNKIVLEIKAKEKFYSDNIAQVYSYLKAKKFKIRNYCQFY